MGSVCPGLRAALKKPEREVKMSMDTVKCCAGALPTITPKVLVRSHLNRQYRILKPPALKNAYLENDVSSGIPMMVC